MMCKLQIKRVLAGLTVGLALATPGFAQSSGDRSPDSRERTTLKAPAQSLIDLELLSRAEQRADTWRVRLFELQMKEADLQGRLEDLDYQLTPDGIQQALAFVASVRPMDELRDALRIRLENEKSRVNKQLELLASSQEWLEVAINAADAEAERLRQRLSSP